MMPELEYHVKTGMRCSVQLPREADTHIVHARKLEVRVEQRLVDFEANLEANQRQAIQCGDVGLESRDRGRIRSVRNIGMLLRPTELREPAYDAFLIVAEPTTDTAIEALFAGTDPGGSPPEFAFSERLEELRGSPAIAFLLKLDADPVSGQVPRVHSVHFAVRDALE